MGTKAHYYDSTLKYGGAKYRATGRGFVLQHEDFSELFRFYAASHLYNGFELLWGLLLLLCLGSWPVEGQYLRTCWSLWAVMVSWIFAPFWFNPMAFDGKKTSQDLKGWLLWMRRKDGTANSSWEVHSLSQPVPRMTPHVWDPSYPHGHTFGPRRAHAKSINSKSLSAQTLPSDTIQSTLPATWARWHWDVTRSTIYL